MNITTNNYVIECTVDNNYYAYILGHEQCFAIGETEEEALENLKIAEEEYLNEINAIYQIDDIA